MKKKIKAIFSDSLWSIAGLMLMNVVAQFAVYPVWNARLGNDAYGDILYLISLLNTYAISMGTGCNYARMVKSRQGEVNNGCYTFMLGLASLIAIPLGVLPALVGNVSMSPVETVLFILLAIGTMWRFYADVEYRLSLHYKGYFLYYLVISVGYGVGILLFFITGLWPLALLPGEIAGLAFVWLRGSILRTGKLPSWQEYLPVLRTVGILFVTNLISNIIFNGDRLLLKNMLGGEAVTIYYQASLLGKTASLIVTPLNSVMIGYLSRYKGELTSKLMSLASLASLALILLGTACCTIGSHILIRLLYPQNYQLVREFFIVANMAQVIYFITNLLTVALLRFLDTRYQMHINVVYAVAFCALCIPSVLLWGMWGFCWALVATCLLRLLTALVLGQLGAKHRLKTRAED